MPDATLADVPGLLTDPAARATLVREAGADPFLRSFWRWYEGLSEAGQANAAGPVLSKLRAVLTRRFAADLLGAARSSFTLAASPRRGRVLAAKAIVIGAVTFVAGLAGAAVAIPVSERLLRDHGNYTLPVTTLTEVRLVAGTAALLAVAAVLAVALGAVLRRSAAAVSAVIGAIVLPYFLAIFVLPAGAGDWLLRLTPAAAFAIQQTIPQYPQVSNAYTPSNGYYPLAPWAGFAVLCGWAALAMGLAVVLLRRRDV